jgi:hypothetical protein
MWSPRSRSFALLASAAAITALIAGGYPLGAQESAKGKSQTAKAQPPKSETPASSEKTSAAKTGAGRVAPPDSTHRVPSGYARLGLTDQQKDRLYKIQADYLPKVQALQKQLDGLMAERKAKFEAVLTREQKQMLAQEAQQKKAASEARKAVSRAAVNEKAGK